MAAGGDDSLDRKRRRRAHDGADIVRIGDLVEHQHDALLRQGVDIGREQGLGLRQHDGEVGIDALLLDELARAQE